MSKADTNQTSTASPVQDEFVSTKGGASIRVSPHGYVTGIVLCSFLTGLLFYLRVDLAAFLVFCLSWILFPYLALNDRIGFDGRSLERTGLLPRLWTWFNGGRRRLKISDIEQVETQAIRAVRRGGNVHYRYRTVLHGKGVSVAFASGGEDFRQMIRTVLPRLTENVLDVRSLDLRKFLADPKETLMKAEFARIPSADVLEATRPSSKRGRPRSINGSDAEATLADLHVMANELRLAGYLPQALESFRRALVGRPADARLLFDFARCLHSYAALRRDKGLTRRSIAALRLSERFADSDVGLLAELGECYVQVGEWRRAAAAFQRVLDRIGDNFRAARGLAEIALRDGKIAHVIHHFASANRVAETPALRRWTRGEADYFSRLNSDDEYMETELARVSLLETIEVSRKTTLQIAFLAFPAVFIGIFFEDELIANIGWAITTVALLIWTGLMITARMLSRRIPYDLVASDD